MNQAGHFQTQLKLSRSRAPFGLFRRTKKIGGRKIVLKTWWVRFSRASADGSSRQVRASLGTEDQLEAIRRATELVAAPPAAVAAAPPAATLSLVEFLEEYKNHLHAVKAKKTALNEWSVLSAFLRANFSTLEGMRLEHITTSMISNHLDRRRTQDKISEKTAYHLRQALQSLFNYAIRVKDFSANPARNVPKPRVSPGEIRYLKLSQIEQVLFALKQDLPWLYPIVATAILAGLRRSEIVWLTWNDVDLDRDRIQVRFKTVHGERYKPKTHKSRIVPVSAELHHVLAALPRTSDWVFPSPEGARWDPDNLTHRLEKAMKKRGWDYTFLVFRHTFGSQLAQKGLSLYKISALMGNSEQVCRNHYAALALDEMQADVSFYKGTRS